MTNTGVWKRLGEIEGLDGHGEAFLGRAREEHGVLGVAVREDGGGQDVALLRARGQAGGGADALHVEDHRGDFGVVAQADEFRHQRDAGTGGGGHGARARPAGAERHADGSQFVFGLHDGVGGLAGFGVVAEALHVADQRFPPAKRTA